MAERPSAYFWIIVRRLPLALAPPQPFGFANPLKTQTFTAARATGKDRFDVVRQQPLYVLAAYWDVLFVALLNAVGILGCGLLLYARRSHLGATALLLTPHAYAIATHALTHMEPRFLLPSSFALAIGIAGAATLMRRPAIGPAITTVGSA